MTRSAEESSWALTSLVRYIRSERKEMPSEPIWSPLYTRTATHVVPRRYSSRSMESGAIGDASSSRISSSRRVMVWDVRSAKGWRER